MGVLPVLKGALIGAVLMVATGTLTPNEARSALNLDVLIVIAAAFGLGAAIEQSGLAAALAGGLVVPSQVMGSPGVLLAVVLSTIVLTELITNNAAAVMMFPVAQAAALAAGGDPRSFAIAVALAASASFLTPIGYQTNTMVYGPGGYRFVDYARLGAPLTVIVVVVITVLLAR
jgi:di/tricarboxylate transporter